MKVLETYILKRIVSQAVGAVAASLATLAAVAILTPLVGTQNQLRELPAEIWSALAYIANWRFIAAGSDYASTFNGAPSPGRATLRHLRANGITVRSAIDVLIATFCIENDYMLLHQDRDFDAFAEHRGLRVWLH